MASHGARGIPSSEVGRNDFSSRRSFAAHGAACGPGKGLRARPPAEDLAETRRAPGLLPAEDPAGPAPADPLASNIEVRQYRCISILTPTPWRCAPLLQTRLGNAAAEELASAFKALSDPGRLRLLSLIATQPGSEACVCHLLKPLGLSQPTVSHHLRVLFEAGLLGRERRGSWVYYRIVPERMEALRTVLALPHARGELHGRHPARARR